MDTKMLNTKVSRHSNSLRTVSLITQTTSFFDIGQSSDKFWRQIDIEEEYFSGHATIIENEFHFKNKSFFSDWKTCTLSIKGNFLVFKKVCFIFFFQITIKRNNRKKRILAIWSI